MSPPTPELRRVCPVCARAGSDDPMRIDSPTLFLHRIIHNYQRAGLDSPLRPLADTPMNLLPLWAEILQLVSVKTMAYVSSKGLKAYSCIAGTCGHKSPEECGDALVEDLWLELTREEETPQTADADPTG